MPFVRSQLSAPNTYAALEVEDDDTVREVAPYRRTPTSGAAAPAAAAQAVPHIRSFPFPQPSAQATAAPTQWTMRNSQRVQGPSVPRSTATATNPFASAQASAHTAPPHAVRGTDTSQYHRDGRTRQDPGPFARAAQHGEEVVQEEPHLEPTRHHQLPPRELLEELAQRARIDREDHARRDEQHNHYRQDQTFILVHFTCNRKPVVPHSTTFCQYMPAHERLATILRTNQVLDCALPHFNKVRDAPDPGQVRAVCFTQMITQSMPDHADRYSPWGIAFYKSFLRNTAFSNEVLYLRPELFDEHVRMANGSHRLLRYYTLHKAPYAMKRNFTQLPCSPLLPCACTHA